MLKVYGVGRGKKKPADGNAAGGTSGGDGATGSAAAGGINKGDADGTARQPGELRMQKELDELEMPPQCQIQFLNPNNIMNFALDVKPEEGYWKNAKFRFAFTIPALYFLRNFWLLTLKICEERS